MPIQCLHRAYADPMFGQDLLTAQTVLAALRSSRSANPAQTLERY